MSAPVSSVVQYAHRNPNTGEPLTLTLVVVPNTSPEEIARNVVTNSALPLEWLKFSDPNRFPAVIVGGGPSAADHLVEIWQAKELGAVIYAANGASKWLRKHGIEPDWQVIADAKEETATLVDPEAKGHLFSSAVNPATMTEIPAPVVWHRAMDGIANCFPEHRRTQEYALIGGTSAGTHAMCLAYAMGHRRLFCYGFDSSHRNGKGHAYSQPMNDGIETCNVTWAGKTYQASIAMKAQAENFMILARTLQDLKVDIQVIGDGLLPAMWNTPPENLSDRDKYRLMWSFDWYRKNSPSEDLLPLMLQLLQPNSLVIDFGCGTGRASLELSKRGLPVMLVDFADNCRDEEAIFLPFLEWDLTEPLPISSEYGFCCDVMEHIAPDDVMRVLENIMNASAKVFFNISTIHDVGGALIHEGLHLTVRPHEWWLEALSRFGTVEFHRQGDSDSLFLVKRSPKH